MVIFVFTLLVEPQINPIKHFPVVTVSHKFILPDRVEDRSPAEPTPGRLAGHDPRRGPRSGWCPASSGSWCGNSRRIGDSIVQTGRRNICSEPMGSHGETMLRLLRPGFHSGTLPKAFAAMRRAVQRGESSDGKRFRRSWATIRRVELDVQRFVERELLNLLTEMRFLEGAALGVQSARASTNRIDVALTCDMWPDRPTLWSWEYVSGKLVSRVSSAGWVDCLESDDRTIMGAAMSGLLQRTGVQEASCAGSADGDTSIRLGRLGPDVAAITNSPSDSRSRTAGTGAA